MLITMKHANRITTTLIAILATMTITAAKPFALEKLEFLKSFPVQAPTYIKSSDGYNLAYYASVPESPQAIVIFYHGAGFYGSSLYQYFATQLADNHNIGCYLFDIRGHGNSQGNRGDAPSVKQVWDDITTAVAHVKALHPNVPLYVGGHSSGAGMLLNYSNYYNNPAIQGYLFVTPYLGRNGAVFKEHTDPATSFIKSVRAWVFMLNCITGGYCFAHTPAVFFNYPASLLAGDPKIVANYTPTMTAATSPENPQELFETINRPFGLFIAADDEQFIAEKMADYKKYVPANILKQSTVEIIPGTKHLDILLTVADQCAMFIKRSNA